MWTLRPEGTAPIVRAYVENKLYGPEFKKPYKVYYTGTDVPLRTSAKKVVCANSIRSA